MKARVYRFEVIVVDFERCSPEDVRAVIEQIPELGLTRVMSTDYRDVEWSDEHPLNQRRTQEEALRKLFEGAPR